MRQTSLHFNVAKKKKKKLSHFETAVMVTFLRLPSKEVNLNSRAILTFLLFSTAVAAGEVAIQWRISDESILASKRTVTSSRTNRRARVAKTANALAFKKCRRPALLKQAGSNENEFVAIKLTKCGLKLASKLFRRHPLSDLVYASFEISNNTSGKVVLLFAVSPTSKIPNLLILLLIVFVF